MRLLLLGLMACVFPLAATAQRAPTASGEWDAGLVAGVEVPYQPCQAQSASDACLRALGLSEQAIAFAFAMDGDFSGRTVGFEFVELGSVDLVVAQTIGNDVFHVPVLVNGSAGIRRIDGTMEPVQVFRDAVSRKLLSKHPQAFTRDPEIRSHRILGNGSQRFTLVENVVDGCRACDIVGTAVTHVDIGPVTGNLPVRRAVGMRIGTTQGTIAEPRSPNRMKAGAFQRNPVNLQMVLNMLGYEAGTMDGELGPRTRQAIYDFQKDRCLRQTGKADPKTLAALANADGLAPPCTRVSAPAATTPAAVGNVRLKDGIYVDDPQHCALKSLPAETVHLQQRVINGPRVLWGFLDECEALKQEKRGKITLFTGICSGENAYIRGQWRFEILSDESFIDREMPEIRQFDRCPDNSLLRRSNSAAFMADIRPIMKPNPLPIVSTPRARSAAPETPAVQTGAGGTDTEKLRLKDGIYVDDPQLCGLDEVPYETVHLQQRRIAGSSIIFGLEDMCKAERTERRGRITEFHGTCFAENTSFASSWRLEILSEESFVDLDRQYTRCPDGSPLLRRDEAARQPNVGSQSTPGGVPASLARIMGEDEWIGTVTQPSSGSTYGIAIRITAGQIRVDYPELSCGGAWMMVSEAPSGQWNFTEQLAYGFDKCVNEGDVTLRVSEPDTLEFGWARKGQATRGTRATLRSSKTGASAAEPEAAAAPPPKPQAGAPEYGLGGVPLDFRNYVEPGVGSYLRKEILASVMPIAVREFDASVEFSVLEMRVSGQFAYVRLEAHRPGGGKITPEHTPMYRSGRWNPNGEDMRIISGFLRGGGEAFAGWIPHDLRFGASGSWWTPMCPDVWKLMPETCQVAQ